MRKIPTLFVRDYTDPHRPVLTPEPNPECAWVLAGEGHPTRKYDGTCVLYDVTGWWARRDVKPGKPRPHVYMPVHTDPTTGKTFGWEPIDQSPHAKAHADALDWLPQHKDAHGDLSAILDYGTFELCGPKINGNPENYDHHVLIPHADAAHVPPFGYTFGDLHRTMLWLRAEGIEGIVWHHPDGRMAKLKHRDYANLSHPAPVTIGD